MSLFEMEIPLDASEAIEAVETIIAASTRGAALPHHLREEVQRRASPVAADGEALGVTAETLTGVAVIGCGPSLRALVGSLRSQGVK